MSHETLITIAATVTSGVLGLALSHKTAIPSILFFLVFGILLGGEFLGLVNPAVFRDNFPQYISLLVALILFEGGATLKLGQYRDISRVLRRLLTLGSAVTLVGVTIAAHFLAGLNWSQAAILGSVLIVTGPTVVIPILQRMRVRENVHNVLKWESILIDPVGVVTAVVIFEFLVMRGSSLTGSALGFLLRFAAGAAIGLAGGWLIEQLLARRRLFRFEGEEMGSLIVVAGVIFSYACAEAVSSHAGLVTATVIGIYLGNRPFAYKEHILRFEKTVTLFALSILFIWLASQIPISLLASVAAPGTALLAVMIFILRPAAVFLSARGDMSLNEKTFIAVFAPRGIVSASLASLFSLHFTEIGGSGDTFLALSFFVIVGSIVFYTLTGAGFARLLRVKEADATGIMLVGVTPLSLAAADEIRKRGWTAQFIDTNVARCENARNERFDAFEGSAFDIEFLESLDRKGIGAMVAMTPSHEVNLLACQAFTTVLGHGRAYRLWDLSDSWENVTSPAYDQFMGRPLLVSFPPTPDGNDWAFDATHGIETLTQTLPQKMKVTAQAFAASPLSRPLFFWAKGPRFVTPDVEIPAETDVVCVRPGTGQGSIAPTSLAKRAFAKVRRLYDPE